MSNANLRFALSQTKNKIVELAPVSPTIQNEYVNQVIQWIDNYAELSSVQSTRVPVNKLKHLPKLWVWGSPT